MREGDIPRAAELLRSGGLVVFPTETVYGVGAHALDPRAAARIFEVKGRPRFDPLIVHLAGLEGIDAVVAELPEAAVRLAERFWPGPLTLVLKKTARVPDLVTAGHDTVAVRVPRHPIAQALLRAAGIPVAAPSANRFGGVSPTRAEHVTLEVDMILDGGPCAVGVESTIVSLAGPQPILLRPGGLPLEAIEAVVGAVEVPPEDALRTLAPGRQTRHYAPGTTLTLESDPKPGPGRWGLLCLQPPADPAGWAQVEVLSPTGDLTEAATHLFAALRRLDAAGLEHIVAQPVPEHGLGRAIMDRLRRAAAGR
ncbi:MAG: threonylcarbamoyl-AMP synthase [Deltaproteobacteria bacterium]|nr:threonylcarbamoyl-AMP synthase [Deltaproteobacteria bacterium]